MQNKLLLIEDVDGLGRKGEIVVARPGFVRNFLLPRHKAVVATPNTLRMQARLTEERNKQAAIDRKESEAQAAHLEGLTVTTSVKIDHEGHMYGSVSAHDIVDLLAAQEKVVIEKRCILIGQPIKDTGVHTIKVKLKEGVTSSFTLKVIPEEMPAVPAPVEKPKAERGERKRSKREE